MSVFELLTSNWALEPWALAFGAALLSGYAVAGGLRDKKKSVLFSIGVILMLIAIISPLDYLGRYYLFSAHMIQHILLLLVVPLLMLLGIPESAAEKALGIKPLGAIMRVLGNPVIAWFLGVGAMWAWHMPSLHSAVVENDNLYAAQQISFVLIGVIFWWPVFAPAQERRLSPLASTLYLASACLGCTVLGILITFAGAGLYSVYVNPADSAGILPYLRDELCITPGVDQQIGGLTMWVPGCLIYLGASMITIAKWYASPEGEELAAPKPARVLARAGSYEKE